MVGKSFFRRIHHHIPNLFTSSNLSTHCANCLPIGLINFYSPSSKAQVGTMPPKATPKVNAAPRLPPLPKLRVRRPNRPAANPCSGILSSMLGMVIIAASRMSIASCPIKIADTDDFNTGCWASNGLAHEGCVALEQQLRACMDAPVCRNAMLGRPCFLQAVMASAVSVMHELILMNRDRSKKGRATSITTSAGCILCLKGRVRRDDWVG